MMRWLRTLLAVRLGRSMVLGRTDQDPMISTPRPVCAFQALCTRVFHDTMLQCVAALGGRDEVGHARSACKFASSKTDSESERMLA